MTELTIAIITRNRAAMLADALASIAAAKRPGDSCFEVLVVINGCADDSAQVIERFDGKLPIRAIDEPRIGEAHARNTAVNHARGHTIAWLDDDVIVSPNWLLSYLDAIRTWPTAGIFGGPIIPRFVGRPPAWFARTWPSFDNVYAMRLPASDGVIEPRFVPYGANYGIRTDLQRRMPYDVRLGRQPGNLVIGGAETKMIRALLAQGVEGRWVLAASVEHVIAPERQTLSYVHAYFVGQGFVQVLNEPERRSARGLMTEAGRLLSRAVDVASGLARRSLEDQIAAFIALSIARGRLLAHLRAVRGALPPADEPASERRGPLVA